MLRLENISKSYAGIPLFSSLSFSLHKGERCAFVGRNGSGKTTLLKIFMGKETPDTGTVSVPKGYKIGFLEQHLAFSEPTVLAEALKGPILKPPHEVESILFGLGFDANLLEKNPKDLSGGYHLRLKLAKVLAEEPQCLLLDEPTNYLDILGYRWLKTYLTKWKGEIICISHDRGFLDAIATHTVGLHRQSLYKFPGDTEHFYEKIVEQERLHEKTRQNLEKKRKHLTDYIERFGVKASKASQAQSKAKALEKIPAIAELAALEDLSLTFPYLPFAGKKIVELTDIFFSYSSSPLIQNISLCIEKGQKIAIIGKNGLGKSTLLRIIAGELSPKNGSYFCSSQAKIGYFGQTHIDRLCNDHTIEEEIALANQNLAYAEVRALCGAVMFSQESAKKRISVLSGGERSRVLLGKILAKPVNLLLLDEPTHHLDIESIEALTQAVNLFEGSSVLVTHDEELLQAIQIDLIIIVHKDRQELFLGNYRDFLEKKGWEEESINQEVKKNEKTARSTSNRPLQNKIAQTEKTIEEKEKRLKEVDLILASAYENGDSIKSTNLLEETASLQKEIDSLYIKLEELYQKTTP
jgi:ATP-binding cassette subfamily F protein 3